VKLVSKKKVHTACIFSFLLVLEMFSQPFPAISVQTFVTLSHIPGYMQWLVSKLASQCKLAAEHGNEPSSFREDLLYPEEEELLQACR
jgi:malonyl-CoA decarboxylase